MGLSIKQRTLVLTRPRFFVNAGELLNLYEAMTHLAHRFLSILRNIDDADRVKEKTEQHFGDNSVST